MAPPASTVSVSPAPAENLRHGYGVAGGDDDVLRPALDGYQEAGGNQQDVRPAKRFGEKCRRHSSAAARVTRYGNNQSVAVDAVTSNVASKQAAMPTGRSVRDFRRQGQGDIIDLFVGAPQFLLVLGRQRIEEGATQRQRVPDAQQRQGRGSIVVGHRDGPPRFPCRPTAGLRRPRRRTWRLTGRRGWARSGDCRGGCERPPLRAGLPPGRPRLRSSRRFRRRHRSGRCRRAPRSAPAGSPCRSWRRHPRVPQVPIWISSGVPSWPNTCAGSTARAAP